MTWTHNKGLHIISVKTDKEIGISVIRLNCRHKKHTFCKNIVAVSKYKKQCGSDTDKRMRITPPFVQHLECSATCSMYGYDRCRYVQLQIMTKKHMMCVYLSLADVLRYKSMVFLRLIPQGVAHHIPLPANKNTPVINTWKHTYLLNYFLALWPSNSLCLLNMKTYLI